MSNAPRPLDPTPIDALASEVTHRILSQPDYKQNEYVAARLLAETKRDHRGRFERADAVVFSVDPNTGETGRRIFVVQGDPADPASLRSDAKTAEAARQPLEQSFDKVYDANQRLFLQQHERGDVLQVPQQSTPPAPAPAR